MSDSLYECSEINLYSKFSKEFISIEKEELTNYVNSSINFNINNFHCFVLIKYEDIIVESIIKTVKKNEDINNLIELIQNKIENTNSKELKKVYIKIFIVENNKKHKFVFEKLKKEFCILNSKLYIQVNEDSFFSYFNKNLKYIFSAIITVFLLIFINKLSSLGILVNFLSLDTLTIISNNIIFYLILFICFLFGISFIGSLLSIIWDSFFNKLNCNAYTIALSKVVTGFIGIVLLVVVTFEIIEFYHVIIKKDRWIISDQVVKSYLIQTREPSLVDINIKIKKEDKYTLLSKTILLMGKDNKFIYYLDINDIKIDDTKVKIEKEVCSDVYRNTKGELLYIDALIALLHIKHGKSKINHISNRRYKILKISEFSFSDKLPDFDKTFCTKP